jgi:hypothetical protein
MKPIYNSMQPTTVTLFILIFNNSKKSATAAICFIVNCRKSIYHQEKLLCIKFSSRKFYSSLQTYIDQQNDNVGAVVVAFILF